MIFVWTGKGGWIPGSLILGVCLMMGVEKLFPSLGSRTWLVTLIPALSGLFCVGLGLHGRFSPARWVLDPATGRERFRRPVHSAYWVRAEYWGLLFLGLAIWLQHSLPPKVGS